MPATYVVAGPGLGAGLWESQAQRSPWRSVGELTVSYAAKKLVRVPVLVLARVRVLARVLARVLLLVRVLVRVLRLVLVLVRVLAGWSTTACASF